MTTQDIVQKLWNLCHILRDDGITYSFNKQYAVPRRYYFVAPRECGISLKKLLLKSDELRTYVWNWNIGQDQYRVWAFGPAHGGSI